MEKKQIKIKAKDEDLKGSYSNLMQVFHTKEEFCLDFFNVFPPQGILVSRIFMSPAHLKKMVSALEDNIQKYEQKFGQVKESEKPATTIGFQAE